MPLFGSAWLWRVAGRARRCSQQIADRGSAALRVIEEWGMSWWDDFELGVGNERCSSLTDIWRAVRVGVAPDHQDRRCDPPQLGLDEEVLRQRAPAAHG